MIKIAKKNMIKYFYFILLSLLVSCSSTGIKLVDEYYIYPPDEYYNSYYLKCKLLSDNGPVIDSVHIVYWNDSTIIIERKAKHDNWIINAFDNKLKYRNNDTVVGPVSTSYIKRLQSKTGLCGTVVGPVSTAYIKVFMENKKFKRLVFE